MSGVIGAGLPIAETKLEDVLDVFGRNLKISLNCVKVGSIEGIDYATMTASVQLLFQKKMRDGTYQTVKVLQDCPVFTLQGGGYSLQLPVAKGDTALVLFSDRNLDNWYTTGGMAPPADGRLHDLSDAIALVGLNALARPLTPQPAATGAVLTDAAGTTQLGLVAGKLTAQNASGTLLTALNDLTTALNTLNGVVASMTTASIAAGVPQAAAAANTAAILAVTTALAALLNP